MDICLFGFDVGDHGHTGAFLRDHDALLAAYDVRLRASLFAGLLTVGGFILSLETFIVIKLKENVYDDARYRRRFRLAKEQLGHGEQVYSPLKRLTSFLSLSVCCSLLAAVVQLTLGFVANYWACLITIGFAVFAVVLLFAVMLAIRGALNSYFEFIDESIDEVALH